MSGMIRALLPRVYPFHVSLDLDVLGAVPVKVILNKYPVEALGESCKGSEGSWGEERGKDVASREGWRHPDPTGGSGVFIAPQHLSCPETRG